MGCVGTKLIAQGSKLIATGCEKWAMGFILSSYSNYRLIMRWHRAHCSKLIAHCSLLRAMRNGIWALFYLHIQIIV
jgi:hypothetical protein